MKDCVVIHFVFAVCRDPSGGLDPNDEVSDFNCVHSTYDEILKNDYTIVNDVILECVIVYASCSQNLVTMTSHVVWGVNMWLMR